MRRSTNRFRLRPGALSLALMVLAGAGVLALPSASPASLTGSTVAPASPVCQPRSTSIPQGAATVVSDAVVANTGGRLRHVVLYALAMGGDQNVYVLLPPGYDTSGATRYPVLYLLHGAGGSYQDWVSHGVQSVIDAAGGTPYITVMPDGGAWGFYSDWYGSPLGASTASAPPAWATYHIQELIPWVDSNYRTLADRQHRAIAGLSMGGFGAMSYAARYPDLFGTAASFSGAVDTDVVDPAGELGLSAASSAFTGSAPQLCVWGDPVTQDVQWRATDPTYLAGNLAHTSLFVAFGNGTPGQVDDTPTASGAQSAAEDGGIEAGIFAMNLGFTQALNSDGIPFSEYYYGPGTHSWPYWMRDLAHFLPQLNTQFSEAAVTADPSPFAFRTIQTQFSAGGWSFTAHRRVAEFTYLSEVSAGGLEAAGSGLLGVVTAPIYASGGTYTVTVRTVGLGLPITTVDHLTAVAGQLAFTVDLGPEHSVQQYLFDTGVPPGWVQAQVTIAQG